METFHEMQREPLKEEAVAPTQKGRKKPAAARKIKKAEAEAAAGEDWEGGGSRPRSEGEEFGKSNRRHKHAA